MTVDWESHREVLKGLYLRDNKSFAEIKQQLADLYGFSASKAQYEAQFKKWNWRKKLQKSEWKYVSKKIEERKGQNIRKKSAVFFNGSMIPFEKVKKEISRHVHPNDPYYFRATPPSPEDVTVCTPPAESMTFPPRIMTSMTTAKRKYSYEEPPPENFRNLRRQTKTPVRDATSDITTIVKDMPVMDVVSTPRFSRCGISPDISTPPTRQWTAPGVIDLDGLPFFQFRRLMRSPDVVNGFEKMLAVNDSLVENLVANYWAQPSLVQHSDRSVDSLALHSTVYDCGTCDGFESLNAYLPLPNGALAVCKPLGIELLVGRYSAYNWDLLEWSHEAPRMLPALLASMPRTPGDDLQQRIDLLLGPPTVESLRDVVEVGVYLSSNGEHADTFIAWMLQIVPWAVLRPILSTPVPTLQAFAASVLGVAARMGNLRAVTELLQQPRLTRLLRSSGEVLVQAVRSSNAELVRVLLRAGARAELEGPDWVPLVDAKTVEVARMLVEAGADVNALGMVWDPDQSGYAPLTALCVAVWRHDVTLARYLIRAGADVDRPSSAGTPLALAARGPHKELLELLLSHGARVHQAEWSDVLLRAAAAGHVDCARLLLDAGAEVNAPADHHGGPTVLQAAAGQGHVEMATFLLERGANVNAPGTRTALMTAVEENHLQLVQLLLSAGADVNMPSVGRYACTALEAAKSRPARSEIVQLLIAKGARDAALPLRPPRKVELCQAVYHGDLDRVECLINLGVQVDMQMIECRVRDGSSESMTILDWALAHDDDAVNVELFRYLLDKLKDADAQNKAPDLRHLLYPAIIRQNIELVETLINAGADINSCVDNNTPLMAAASKGNGEMVRFLLRKGADINAIVENDYMTTALQASICSQNLDIFDFLLANGARINAPIGRNGCSELAYAARTGSIRPVRALLDRGAEVNAAFGHGGCTALQQAARLYRPDMAMVQLLLERGADVNAPGYTTALQAAATHGHFQIALLFLEAGADINAQALECPENRPHRRTALETAAFHGRLDLSHLFLQAGADLHLPIEERYVRAASFAREQGHILIADILEGWDEDSNAQNPKGKERFVDLD